MSEENYQKILLKISRSSGIDIEELERRVDAKRAKLAGLISKEGAAQVIAAELGINFEKEKLKINELLPGMRNVNVVGKIIDLAPVRTYKNKKGVASKVANMRIADDTSNIKVVLWDVNHIELIEKGKIKQDDIIEINNGSVRAGEIHLGSFSELKISSEVIENPVTERVVHEKKIKDLVVGDNAKVRGFIVQSFEPKAFNVCPECKKRANPDGAGGFNCEEHGKITPEKRILMNLVLDDGSSSIRSVLFSDVLNKMGLDADSSAESLTEKKQELIGKEIFAIGDVRLNKYFNEPEFIVSDIKEVDLDELLKKLENEQEK